MMQSNGGWTPKIIFIDFEGPSIEEREGREEEEDEVSVCVC